MKSKLYLILAVFFSLSYVAFSEEQTEEDWIGIGDLGIVDVHHTAGYITAMNGSDSVETSEASPFPLLSHPSAQTWSFSLRDEFTRDLELTLFQVDSQIFGQGIMTVPGGQIQTVTAAGLVAGEQMELRVVVLDAGNMYRLWLNVAGGSASGSYTGYAPSGSKWFGSVFGRPSVGEASQTTPPDSPGRNDDITSGIGMG